jgi:hypothetical protein
MMEVASADRQLTVNDYPYTQFMVYDKETNFLTAMTEENCNTEHWDAAPDVYQPESFFDKIKVAFNAMITWTKLLFELIINSIKTA